MNVYNTFILICILFECLLQQLRPRPLEFASKINMEPNTTLTTISKTLPLISPKLNTI